MIISRRSFWIYLVLFVGAALIWYVYAQVWSGFGENQRRYEKKLGLGRGGRWAQEYPGTVPERQTGFASDYPTEEEQRQAILDKDAEKDEPLQE